MGSTVHERDEAAPPGAPPGVPADRMPRHVAIIMDGNGRWAAERGMPRVRGHEQGARTVRTIVTHAARLDLRALTLYSFSSENWKRPREEVEFLMGLYAEYLVAERPTILDNNVRFMHLGRRAGLPARVLDEMDRTVELSAGNTGLTLALALNYGSRDEIVDAVRSIAEDARRGAVAPERIDEALISSRLYSAGLPDPDLLIRTASERRLSNFLLWQLSYAEIHVCDAFWPDFGVEPFNAALRDYACRQRRFGDVGR
ncbi:MAG: Ditrans,polycis-undecaprenyl-diphosphate synthase ((2E,6E)-farnesyl-diphosphate specific) [Phycisphaerae bacterium]|nr:Ditrans,polycis-undecaprenyl-diphosphate synthase ((2E,6E)-farnesyl-diphosphate specific) [Phycisphaerae bacterium]